MRIGITHGSPISYADAHAPLYNDGASCYPFQRRCRRSAIAPFQCDRWEEVEVSDGSDCGQHGGLVPRDSRGDAKTPKLPLEKYLEAIPRLESLASVPAGTPVLVRGDVDAKPGPRVGDGDIRLRSMKETLEFGRKRGWKQVIFGHIGREPEKSLSKVRARLVEILGCEVTFIEDWFDAEAAAIKDEVPARSDPVRRAAS